MWDGAAYGRVENYNLVGEGDSARTQFFLPNRNIGASSIAVRTANQATGVTSNWLASSSNSWPYSMNATPGILTFANSANTIPASGHDLMAIYGCRYRCIFEPSGITMTEIARGVYRMDLKLAETAFIDP